MIIPVVSDDIIYFFKLQSKINQKRYELRHVKSEEDIVDIILNVTIQYALLILIQSL